MHNKKVPAHNTRSCFTICTTDYVKNSNLKWMQYTLVFYMFSYCVEWNELLENFHELENCCLNSYGTSCSNFTLHV